MGAACPKARDSYCTTTQASAIKFSNNLGPEYELIDNYEDINSRYVVGVNDHVSNKDNESYKSRKNLRLSGKDNEEGSGAWRGKQGLPIRAMNLVPENKNKYFRNNRYTKKKKNKFSNSPLRRLGEEEAILEKILENNKDAGKLFSASRRTLSEKKGHNSENKEDVLRKKRRDKIILKKILDLSEEYSRKHPGSFGDLILYFIKQRGMNEYGLRGYPFLWTYRILSNINDNYSDFIQNIQGWVCKLSEPLQNLLTYIYEDLYRWKDEGREGLCSCNQQPCKKTLETGLLHPGSFSNAEYMGSKFFGMTDIFRKVTPRKPSNDFYEEDAHLYKKKVDELLKKIIEMLINSSVYDLDYKKIRAIWDKQVKGRGRAKTLENVEQINFFDNSNDNSRQDPRKSRRWKKSNP